MSVRRDPITRSWYFRVRVTYPDGRRVRIFGTPGVAGPYHDLRNTERGAEAAEQRCIANALTGQAIAPPREVPTIESYVDPFMAGHAAAHKPSSRKDARQRLDAYIVPVVGKLRLNELRQEHVDALVKDMLDDEASRKQVNNTTSVLSSLVGYAVANKLIADPALKFWIKGSSAQVDAVAPENVDLLLGKAEDERYKAAVLLAADVGLRIGEIRALPWIEVNEIGRELRVSQSYDRSGNLTEPKSWERRTLPINERTWAVMKSLTRRGPLVFCRLDGRPLGYDATIQVAHELYVAAGVPKPSKPWHSLRHTFGTELAARGADIETIRDMMGHKSIETTQRYLHSTRERKRAAVERLGSGRAVDSKRDTK